MTRTIKSVHNTTKIIDCLQKLESGTVSEVAETTGLTVGTVHTHLATLIDANYVVKDGTTYRLGPKFLTAGEYVRNHADIYRAAKEQIEDLAEETSECAHLIIEHDGKLFALYERFGQNAVGVEYHDRKREQALKHLHCTAAGKAILSQLPESEVRSIIQQQGMPQNTDQTITDVDRLIEDLVESRNRGYAFADEEQVSGIRAVGSPVTTSESCVEGALAVSGPTSRMKDDKFEKKIPELVVEAANICEVNLHTIRNQSVNGD